MAVEQNSNWDASAASPTLDVREIAREDILSCALRPGQRLHTGSLVASPDYLGRFGTPDHLEALLTHSALLQGTEAWRLKKGDRTVTIHPRGTFKADNGTALLAAALAGLGIAALPEFLITEHVASGALLRH